MEKQVLVLVDIQNTYYGSLNDTDGKRQIDYEALMPFLHDQVEEYLRAVSPQSYQPYMTVSVDFIAYVVQTPRHDGAAFFAFLRSLGYGLRSRAFPDENATFDPDISDPNWKGSVGSSIQMDMLDLGPSYDAVVVVSGSGIFEKVFRAMSKRWPGIVRMVAAFDNTMHHTYTTNSGLVDHTIILDDRVLRDKHGR